MNKNTKIVVVCAAVLAAVVVVFAFLNRENVAEKRSLSESGTFRVLASDREYTVAMDDIEALGPHDVAANYKKNGKQAVEKTYTGVTLKSVLDRLSIDYSQAQSVSFTAADGYASAVPIADALNEESCYIVIAEQGRALGAKESGGSGPFMMILAQDQFSQRWCKFLLEVKLG